MSKKFYIISTPSLPISGNFWHTVNKFVSGFEQLGYSRIVVTSDEQLSAIEDDADNFMFLGDQGLPQIFKAGRKDPPPDDYQPIPMTIFKSLSRFHKTPKICWFYHNFFFFGYGDLLPKAIITGEHFHAEPEEVDAKWCYEQQKHLYYEPLTFLSHLSINMIGTFERTSKWHAQFVGAAYKTEWTSRLENCYIHHTPPEISEDDRIFSFFNSDIALGFSSDANIRNRVVTERVAEALSYGNMVITDNPAAYYWTGGIAEYVTSYEELVYKISTFINNREALKEKQAMGYEWAKKQGTYTHLAQRFIEKAKALNE
jgi:hypothetical protein